MQFLCCLKLSKDLFWNNIIGSALILDFKNACFSLLKFAQFPTIQDHLRVLTMIWWKVLSKWNFNVQKCENFKMIYPIFTVKQ